MTSTTIWAAAVLRRKHPGALVDPELPRVFVRGGGLELTSTPSRRESRPSVLPHEINDLRHLTCG